MYNPQTAKKLLYDGIHFLSSIENKVDVTAGYDTLLLLEDLYQMHPNIDIKEPIIGAKFKNFIIEMYRRYDIVENYNGSLPFMPYNIRNGLYASTMGLIAEYMSFYITSQKFQSVHLLQDFENQKIGNDIAYRHNNKEITADIKLSTTNWLNNGPVIKCHQDWFHIKKNSTRFHIVDVYNGIHLITGRTFLRGQYEKSGNIVKLNKFNNNLCNIFDIKPYTQIFRD